MTAAAYPAPGPGFQPGLWRSVWKLFRLRLVLFVMNFKHARPRKKFGYIVLGVLIVAAMAGTLAVSWLLLNFMRSPELARFVDPAPFLRAMPVLILTAAFIGLLITSFGVLLQALYLANDLDFLLSAPLPMRAVFVTKLVQAILPNFSFIALFGLPIMYGLGLANGYWLPYFIFVPIVFLAVALSAAGLSSLLVMGVVRIFPARRVAEVLGFITAIFSFVCSQSGQLSRNWDFTEDQVAGAAQTLARLDSPWNPLAIAGRGMLNLGQGQWLAGFGQTLLALAVGAGIFYLALWTAEQLYYTGWARIQVGTRRRRQPADPTAPARARPRTPALLAAFWQRIPAAVRGMIVKDGLTLRRDLRNLSQVITPLIFGIIYGVILLGNQGEIPAGRGEAPALFMDVLRNGLVYANVALSLFIGWTLQSRLATMGFSQEGKSYWLLKTAPVSARTLLVAKFLVAFLPTLVLGWVFLALISLIQRTELGIFLYGLVVVALSNAGAVGINLAFGVAGANLKWEDPRKMNLASYGCLSVIVSMVYLPLSAVLFFGPPVAADLLNQPHLLGQGVGLIAGGALGLACAIVPPTLAEKRVALIGEE